jgi:hypothetical protein
MMKRTWISAAILTIAVSGLFAGTALRGAPAKKPALPQHPVMEAINGLVGIWEVTSPAPKQGDAPNVIVFRTTSGGTAMIETMFSRSAEEMVNMYTIDGDSVVMTHYCMVGNQPRMRAKSIDKGVIKFEYVDATNLKSRDESHMDSVEMTIDGDKLTEKWAMYENGKVTSHAVFELKRKK